MMFIKLKNGDITNLDRVEYIEVDKDEDEITLCTNEYEGQLTYEEYQQIVKILNVRIIK